MRKKWAGVLLAFSLSVFMIGCGNQNMVEDLAGKSSSQSTEKKSSKAVKGGTEGSDTGKEKDDSADSGDLVDLTELNSTMVYSEVYNMMAKPEDYIGKQIKMQGNFCVYEGDKQNYFSCLIQDATACCAQGLEFELKGEHQYPEDYPDVDAEITVVGTFDTYEEDGYTYCVIREADMQES